MRWLVLAAIATGCSYGASFDDCAVACRSEVQCPSGFTCGDEGLCRAAGTSQACASVLGDAALTKDARDAPPGARCAGTATACPSLVAMTTCNDQDGCGWLATTCTNTRDCSIHTTSTSCDADAACFTSFVEPYCRPAAGYCPANSSTQAQCEAVTYCAFGGGCQGTAGACSAYHDAASCGGQAGCSWQ